MRSSPRQGLSSNDRVAVCAYGIDPATPRSGCPSEGTEGPLYRSAIAPDSTGNVRRTFAFALPFGEATAVAVEAWVPKSDGGKEPCSESTTADPAPGCTIVRVRPTFAVPRLAVGWATNSSVHVLIAGARTGRPVLLIVAARHARKPPQVLELVREQIAPNTVGEVGAHFTVKVPADADAVCASARWLTDDDAYKPAAAEGATASCGLTSAMATQPFALDTSSVILRRALPPASKTTQVTPSASAKPSAPTTATTTTTTTTTTTLP